MRLKKRTHIGISAILVCMIGTSDRVWAAVNPEASQDAAREADMSVPEREATYGSRPTSDKEPYKVQEGSDVDIPAFSLRLDLFNGLVSHRLRLELEIGLWKFFSFEIVPAFVVGRHFVGFDVPSNLTQFSNGLGPISGASLGLGFWPNGRPLKGLVLRLIFTDYGYTYETKDQDSNLIDKVSFTERRLYVMIGSHSNVGLFTFAWGFGMGVELNRKQRCYGDDRRPPNAYTRGCDGNQIIAANNHGPKTLYDLNEPYYIFVPISLGIVIDP